MVEVNEGKFGQIRIDVIEEPFSDNALFFIIAAVEPGSTITAEIWPVRLDLLEHDYICNTGSPQYAPDVISAALDWTRENIPGSCSKDYLAYYLDECCFKFNGRERMGELFHELLKNAVQLGPIPYAEIISKKDADD